ncbi:tautomerase family protein [Rhodoferax ferrireducens]
MTDPLVEATGTPMASRRVWIHDVPKENSGIAGIGAKSLWR